MLGEAAGGTLLPKGIDTVADKPAREAGAEATRRGRRPKLADANVTRETILDAAEALFADHGFHGVTVREVARAAAVDPALLHYYFTSKRGLFDAAFLRRAAILNDERLAALDAYEAEAGEAMTVEGCLDAFMRPVMHWWAHGGSGWKSYFRLVALANNSPEWGGATMGQFFDPVIQRFIDLLRRVLPQARDEDLYWSWHFVSGALTHGFAETGRIDKLSGGVCRSDDVAAIAARMAPFMAAGIEAIAAVPSAAATSRKR
jgi:AcrR family transcriptional regulator